MRPSCLLFAAFALLGLAATLASAQPVSLSPFRVVDDAIPEPLTRTPGDVARGRALALYRSKGNCITCHTLPVNADFQGDFGPPLEGVAERWTEGELRLRIMDSKRINPDGNMPSFSRLEGLHAVRRDWVGRPILTGQEVEDILAYLLTLR